MRLAIFLDAFEVTGGGRTNVIETATRLVKDYGYQIDIFCRKIPNPKSQKTNFPTLQPYNFPTKNLRIIIVGPETSFFNPVGRLLSIFTMLYSFLKHHQKKPYDLINAHVYIGVIPAKMAALITKLPIVLTVHGTNLTDLENARLGKEWSRPFPTWLEKQICFKWKYSAVIAVGEGYKRYPNVNKNIFVIPNGVELHNVGAIHVGNGPYSAQASQGKRDRSLRLLFVGRFQKIKGVEVLLKALSLINSSKRPICNLVGYGYEIENLQKMVKTLKLKSSVNFKGQLSKEQLAKEYQCHDLLVVPSLSEGDGIVIKEAWANCLPVLATRCNGPEYYVEEGKDGWLVEKNNPQKLAEKIAEITNLTKDKLTQIGKNGFAKAKAKYQWDSLIRQIDQVFQSVI